MFWLLMAIFVVGVLMPLSHGVYGARKLPRHRQRADAVSPPPGSEPLSPS